jgi:hypothetical protein
VTVTAQQVRDRVIVVQAAGSTAGLYSKQSFDDAFWAAKLEAAKALVLRYAPDAPDAIHDEAVIRTVGYLFDRSPALQDRRSDGIDVSQAPGQISALRHSGAMALLSPWKVRRAGAI